MSGWRAICLICSASLSTPVCAEPPLQGLLTLPDVFGETPCEPFEPKDIALHASAASASRIGRIHVAQPWTMLGEGACTGLRVEVDLESSPAQGGELPARELDYETPAAIVLEAQPPWYRVQMPTGSAWLLASTRDHYHPLAELLTDGLSYIAAPDLVTWDHPQGKPSASSWPVGTPVNVRDARVFADTLWLRVEILSHSVCDAPRATDRAGQRLAARTYRQRRAVDLVLLARLLKAAAEWSPCSKPRPENRPAICSPVMMMSSSGTKQLDRNNQW
ncbi:MAG: hypothetical protein E6Q42_04510 [Dechloromonas sp.]|nr:MAG: hypothetical protein E6Q42_04510 [Dechloromonas sp.]